MAAPPRVMHTMASLYACPSYADWLRSDAPWGGLPGLACPFRRAASRPPPSRPDRPGAEAPAARPRSHAPAEPA